MKILYGVQGTGNGHITRARAMAAEFAQHPVQVDFLFSGRTPDKFFDMAVFGQYRVVSGLTFVTQQGKIRPIRTAIASQPLQFLKDIRALDLDSYDLVVTDFEPVTAWAGKLRKKKVIGLGHQYAFHYPIPQHRADFSQKVIMKYFAPANTSVGLHWHHFDQPVLPPVAPVGKGTYEVNRKVYVVYLPFESIADIRELFHSFTQYKFLIYHPDAIPGEAGHLNWFRPGRETFQRDLHRCEGVICNAGFELASEVLQLGRKLLVKPVHGQTEQYSNALAIDLLGYGHVMYRLDREKLGTWLPSTCKTQIRYPNVAAAICQWILDGANGGIQALSSQLWKETEFPDLTPATRTDDELSLFPAASNTSESAVAFAQVACR